MPRAGSGPIDLGRTLGNKSVQLRVRVTERENQTLHDAMRHAGYESISDFVRWCLLEGAGRVLAGPSAASVHYEQEQVYAQVGALEAAAPPQVWETPSASALLGIPLRGEPRPLEVDDDSGWA